MTLKDQVKSAIETFFKRKDIQIYNERDFQLQLAHMLAKKFDVHLEYFVPKSELDGNGNAWNSDLYVDIVVAAKEGTEFLPVELKFKTRKPEEPIELRRFGEELKKKTAIIKNQAAQNLGHYGFWKDVRRLELLCAHFKKIKNGLAIFLTNDMSYVKGPRKPRNEKQPSYCQFSICENRPANTSRSWFPKRKRQGSSKTKYPDFELERPYAIKWTKMTCLGLEFRYCIVEV